MQLADLVTNHFRLIDAQKTALAKLGIKTVRDLLFHFPFRYEQGGDSATIAGLVPGMETTLVGTLEKLETKKSWKRKIPISQGYLRDQTGRIQLMWFNQPYIAKMYADGTLVKAVGKVAGKDKKIYLANPQLQKVSATEATGLFAKSIEAEVKSVAELGAKRRPDVRDFAEDLHTELFAQYPESRGVTSLWFRHAIAKILQSGALEQIEDPLPAELLKKYNLPTLKTALVWVHTPQKIKDAEAARKRFAFEEVFLIQLERQREKLLQQREKSFAIDAPQKDVEGFVESFPFTATKAQNIAIENILKDMRSGHPMSRLLEGDVGSGKTAVAATAAYAVIHTPLKRPQSGLAGTLQVAYMAPTEILAKQHFESFIQFFEHHPINIGLITGSGCFKFPSKINRDKITSISRTQLLKWVQNGEIPILIGTHALIQKSVQFKHLALVVIDEQHRFGTRQRKELTRKPASTRGESTRGGDDRIPHLLSMTATPIPRTLALTIYGDLDLTLLDEMPAGRKPVITEVVTPQSRAKSYEKIREQLKAGRQVYVICPRIDPPRLDVSGEAGEPDLWRREMKSVKEEAKRLKRDVFPEYEIAILHSKMTPKEKDATMAKFVAHEIDILVATSVVEVGVNVANATVILIEGAERFGLAQLHQLRGRVVRSNHQAYCFVFPESKGDSTVARLKALVTAKNGFELAEQDLLQRGPGELAGRRQWGISDIGMEALKNLKLVEAARNEALALVQKDENLTKHPLLARAITARTQALHFE